MKFAPEGIPFFIGAAILTLIVYWFTRHWITQLPITILPIIILCFMFFFFRDPDRVTPAQEDAIISPADGKVILIKQTFEKDYLKRDVQKFSIFMSPFNVHVNRAPFDGAVVSVRYTKGSFHNAYMDEASSNNENIAMVMSTAMGDILVRQVAGSVARRTVCRVNPGDTLKKGQRFGIIKFSSRVDLYLPLSAQITARLGDKVKAGETIIGRWSANHDAAEVEQPQSKIAPGQETS
ncbi:MAG: phosphatidylserine decarboxylase family protein [Nitrospirae bacterium]|nr:phosphatidylserine decarboxylase family protein [Nitrospirota bacterium]MBF0593146.1 phosphatidylserine decarboxylase family protein [Nitrospirota bacterium]